MSQHILFNAAGLCLALPSRQIKTVHEDLPLQSVENTKPWFLGIGVTGGRLLPVSDLGAFSGLSKCKGRTIELDPSVGIAGLRVDQVFGLSEKSSESIEKANSEDENKRSLLKDAKNLTLTSRCIVDRQAVFHVLDIASLLLSPAFINIAAGNSGSEIG